ncbi:MAG: sensor histidine kinase [Bdellovibrionota bacterium]
MTMQSADTSIPEILQCQMILHLVPDALLLVTPRGEIQWVNHRVEPLLGYLADELKNTPVEALIPPRFREQHQEYKKHYFEKPVLREMGRRKDLFALRKDGSEIPVEIMLSPLDKDGENMVLVSIRDVSEWYEAEQHRRLLSAELDHRVRNMLNLILSLTKQSLRNASSLEAFQGAFLGRISALSQAYQLVSEQSWKALPIVLIIENAIRPFTDANCFEARGSDRSQKGQIVVEGGENFSLPAKHVQALSLILHEILTNSSKYGALTQKDGSILISWMLTGDVSDQLALRVFERGTQTAVGGLEVRDPSEGFGLRLIRRVVEFDLEGRFTLEIDNDGYQYEFTFPHAFAT